MSYFNLEINWDFDSYTKNKYFGPVLDGTYDFDFCLGLLDSAFYEINAQNNITVSFVETKNCQALFVKNLKFPFIYIRNVGVCNILINSSPSVNTYESSLIEKTNATSSLCNYDYLLKPKENLLLTFCSSQNGELYFTKSIFPFGFFYRTINERSLNPSGLYPICCYIYSCQQFPAEITETGLCLINYQIVCGVNDYKWKFLNYYYCWSGQFLNQASSYESVVFYNTSINQITQDVINCSTERYNYIYCALDFNLRKDDDVINLTGINSAQVNCYFLYENNFYDYDSDDFDDIIHEIFVTSGFNLTGDCYILTGSCCCSYLYTYSGFDYNIEYCPTFLYENIDCSIINQYSGSGYSGYIYSNYFSGQVDSGVIFEISPTNENRNFLDPIYLKSSNGSIDFCSEIYSQFKIENNQLDILIECDTSIDVLYSLSVVNKLFYKYSIDLINLNNAYTNIYDSYGNYLLRTNKSINNFCFEKNCYLDEEPVIKFNLNNISTSGINLKNINSKNYVLPTASDFDYEYCFLLKNENFEFENSVSGFWGKKENFPENKRNINSITFIETGESYYLNNKPEFYCIDLTLNTCPTIFTNKLACGFSNPFIIKKQSIICSFCFCGVEYKYNPIDYIDYNGNKIYLPNSGIDIHLHLSPKQLTFTFPILALGSGQIFINSSLNFINNYESFALDLCYKDFKISKNYENLNRICIPKIKKCNSVTYEAPDLNLKFLNCRLVCETLSLCASLNNGFAENKNDLYNFYLYLYSFFNLEESYTCQLTGFKYGTDEYKFAFLNLERKLDTLEAIEFPDVYFCEIKNETFSGYDSSNIFPYKLSSGSQYSYASILLNEVKYYQCLDGNYSFFECTGLLSNTHIGKNFDTQQSFYCFSCSGNNMSDLNYLESGFSKNGFGQIGDCFLNIKIAKEKLTGSSGSISLFNNFIITGTQPIKITSDVKIENIQGDLLYNNYIKYNELNFKNICCNFDSVFYFTYDFNGPLNNDLFLKTDQNYAINCINLIVECGSCSTDNFIFSCDKYNPTGLICNNIASLTYPFECILCLNSSEYVCNQINIRKCL